MESIKFFNYGRVFPGEDAMLVIAEIDGVYAGRYRGIYDGNVIRCKLIKRAVANAPSSACLAPEVLIGRIRQPIPVEHMR